MTRLFVTQPLPTTETPKTDETSPKVPEKLFTVFQAPELPVPEPNLRTVRREKKARTTWMIGLIFALWLLATFVIILHFAPGCIYRRLRSYTITENEPQRLPLEKYVLEQVDSDAKLPQIKLVDGSTVVDKSDDDASEAIQTLLKRPDVQHLVIVGRKESSDDQQTVKGVMVINGLEDKMEENKEPEEEKKDDSSEEDVERVRIPGQPYPTQRTFVQGPNGFYPPQPQFPPQFPPHFPPQFPPRFPLQFPPQFPPPFFHPPQPMFTPWDALRHAIWRWRAAQMFRQAMIWRAMQDLQARYAAMHAQAFAPPPPPPPPAMAPGVPPFVPMAQFSPRFVPWQQPMAFQQPPPPPPPMMYYQQQQQQQQQQPAMAPPPPAIPPTMLNMPPLVQPQAIQPMQTTNSTPKRLDSPHQFPLQVEKDRQPLVPQQENLDIIVDPNLPVERDPEVATVQLHKAEGKTDERDQIFKMLQAQSQEIVKAEESLQKGKETEDIYRELQQKAQEQQKQDDIKEKEKDATDAQADEQQTAMVMIEDSFPRRQAQELFNEQNATKRGPETVDAKADEDETALVMIEGTFPRKSAQTPEVVTPAMEQEPAEQRQNISDPLAAFFRFFQQEAVKRNENVEDKEKSSEDAERGREFRRFFEEALERDEKEDEEKPKQSEYEDITATTAQPSDKATAIYSDLQDDTSGMDIELDVPEPARRFQGEKTESPAIEEKEPEAGKSVTVEGIAELPYRLL